MKTPADAADRPATLMDRIFDFPLLYRIKISLVKAVVRPASLLLIRNQISEEQVILDTVSTGSKVYEIGCGDGNGFRLFEGAGKTVQYTASDYNRHMIDYCRTHYPAASWEYYSGGPYPHADAEFDYCVIRHVLHHIPNREDIVMTIREATRIAKKVVLLEPLQSEGAPLRLLKSVYWRATDGGVNYMRLEELHNVFREAGAEIAWESWTQPLRQKYVAILTRSFNQTAS